MQNLFNWWPKLLTCVPILVLSEDIGISVQQTMYNGYSLLTGTRTGMQQSSSS